ncbi:hypothetical protein COLO4_27463 [Corchorus olitorius]|uniref:Uncharacterized protein n=1 Tax=Corchorus olitorius TaxID=93759 RepID=A0A1R3HR18_9ROSI|nr:hypothetical protein COLO4_27463 [Corchorus olitorius]
MAGIQDRSTIDPVRESNFRRLRGIFWWNQSQIRDKGGKASRSTSFRHQTELRQRWLRRHKEEAAVARV